MAKSTWFLLIALALILLAGCSGGRGGNQEIPGVDTPAIMSVLSTSLDDKTSSLPVDVEVQIQFSQTPANGTVFSRFLSLIESGNDKAIGFTTRISTNNDKILIITPETLVHGADYQLTVLAGLPSESGSILSKTRILVFSTVGDFYSCNQKAATMILPTNGASQIPPGRPLKIFFRQDLMPENPPDDAAILLRDRFAHPVPVSLSLDKPNCALIIKPTETLEYHHNYQLDVNFPAFIPEQTQLKSTTMSFRTMDSRFLGASFFNSNFTEIDQLQGTDLLGVLRFGGRWVTEMALPAIRPDITVPTSYLQGLDRFCDYAVNREQKSIVQLPVFLPSSGIQKALDYLKNREDHCNLLGFAIGNEIDRFDTDEENYAASYLWEDYLPALERIVPMLKQQFPDTARIALDLSSFEEYNDYNSLREWVDPFCSSKSSVIQDIDFLSVHFYPYTGAQKLWDMLNMGRVFKSDLAQLPDGCPDLLLGEYNTTYQWRKGSTYPGSGGDGFMPLLTLPEILHQKKVLGLLHWSLLEDDTSTLGLFQKNGLQPRSVYPGYLMLAPVFNSRPVAAKAPFRKTAVSAFLQDNDTLHLYLGNYTPVFQRFPSIGNAPTDDIQISIPGLPFSGMVNALPPMSLTHLLMDAQSGIITRERISYQQQDISAGLYDTQKNISHCVPLADFSEPNKTGPDFVGPDFNQNLKIASAGTPMAVAPPALLGSVAITEEPGSLKVTCQNQSGRSYCGVSLPVIADTAEPSETTLNWSEAAKTGFLKLQISTRQTAPLALKVEMTQQHKADPDQLPYLQNLPFQVLPGSTNEIILPWKQFAQPDGTPAASLQKVADTLTNIAAFRLMQVQPDASATFRIHKLEICDRWE